MDRAGVSKVMYELFLRQGSLPLHLVVDVASQENSCMRLDRERETRWSQDALVTTWLCKCDPYQQIFKRSTRAFVTVVSVSAAAEQQQPATLSAR